MTSATPSTAAPPAPACHVMCSHAAGANPDRAMANFVRAILPSDQAQQVLDGFYTEAFHASLLTRLAALRGAGTAHGHRRVAPLPKWKVHRVEAYVDANIGERLALGDLAAAAGLSDMHFAAQFRLAMGVRPHDYVTHRRILHARRMLAETKEPIIQVALAVGFQTQAHFTTVFRKVVGITPFRWREAELARRAERGTGNVMLLEGGKRIEDHRPVPA